MSIRIGGLASGMDIDTIVRDMMKVERMPLDRLFQKKKTIEWQRDEYREMNKLLNELDLLLAPDANGIGRQSTFIKKAVSSTDESKVIAKNLTGTTNISTTISVNNLAEAASMYSKDNINFNASNTLQSEIDAGNISAFSTTFSIQAIQADGTLAPITAENTFTIDPATQSLNDVINEINNRKIGVTAFYDQQTGKVAITANQTGDVAGDAEIKLDGLNGDFLTKTLKLEATNIIAADTTSKTASGSVGVNASVIINGLTTTRLSNTFQINGFEYTLIGKTTPGVPVTIASTTDTDAIYDSITDFVNKYNEMLDTINGKLSEERYRKFPPLTDEQKEVMSDKEIELWEEKAKSGLLRNDSLLSSGLTQMRQDLYSRVSGVADGFSALIDIGIKPSSSWRDKGKLVIDENKLRKAISENPNEINKLFNSDGKILDANGVEVVSEAHLGLVKKLRKTLQGTVKNIEEKAGNTLRVYSQYSLGKELNNIDSQIDRFQDRLIDIENRYWKQFTAMEKAIDKANQQGAYLMQQFGGGM